MRLVDGAKRVKMQAKRLVAVVVTYNRLPMLQLTVARFLENPPEHLERLLVVDNASTDGTGAWLATQSDPRLSVLSLPTNTGGAGGFDAGMRHAMAAFDPDWLVVTDDDGRPAPGALAAFHSADFSAWDAFAAAVYFPEGTICEMNRPSRNPFWHLSAFLKTALTGGRRNGFHLSPDAYEMDAVQPIDVTSFVGFFISREGVAKAGYPDPSLFIYGDDGLYTLELSRRGGRICFAPQVRFEHDCSTFGNDQRGRFQPLWKVYYYHRNLLMLYRLAAGWLFVPVLLLVVPKWLLKLRHHRDQRGVFLRLLGRAIWHGLRGHTQVAHADILRLASGDRNAAK